MPPSFEIRLEEVPESFRPYAEAILSHADPAPGLIRLLGTLGGKAKGDDARDFALLLRRTLPPSARLNRVTEVFIRGRYPHWYIRAVNDEYRNRAYRQALENLVTPETVVVEGGTGSGLFAMMAARAGARHVYTCENDAHVAEIARSNIARNGLADRITLFDCRYEDLKVGAHLPCRADLFIHEFVASEFLVPKMGSMFDQLHDQLLTEDAVILPSRFASVGMIVGGQHFLSSVRVPPKVEGFDVSGINLLAAPDVSLRGPVMVAEPLSAAHVLAEFDLMSRAGAVPGGRILDIEATAGGEAVGVLQWVRHGFPDGTTYENSPDLDCIWRPSFWPFPHSVALSKGDQLKLLVENTDTELFIDLMDR